MTIRKGDPWGERAPLAVGDAVAANDAELADVLRTGSAATVGLLSGDLCRTVGATADGAIAGPLRRAHLYGPDAVTLPIDVVEVRLDDLPPRLAVAHVVLRRRSPLGWWLGPVILAMNAQYIGRFDVAPTGHPNDGRFEVLEISMSPRQRWQALRRAPTGTHVPHPRIAERRGPSWARQFASPIGCWIDGRFAGSHRDIHLRVVPDAARIVV